MIPFIDLKAQQRRLADQLDASITRVLDHGKFIMGPEVAELETKLCELTGADHTISCSSGTDALVLALLALGVSAGDAVVVPTFTFAATAEAVALLGATPVFADLDPATFNMGPQQLLAALDSADQAGLRTVGVIPVDLFGLPAEYEALDRLATARGMWVLADGAQSLGGSVGSTKVGSLAPVTATSFFPAKPLGCFGDGGAVFCADEDQAARLRSLRVHGKGKDKYDNVRIGINGRLDTIQAAILLVKLSVFNDEIERRQAVAQRYSELLSEVCATPAVPEDTVSAWAQYTVRVPARDSVAKALAASGVPTAVYYPIPLHLQTAYRHFPTAADMDASTVAAAEVLSLPMHPYLEMSDQDIIVEAVREVVGSSGL